MCPWILLDNENDDYNDENKCKENYFIWFQVSIHKTGTRIINQLIDIIYVFIQIWINQNYKENQ